MCSLVFKELANAIARPRLIALNSLRDWGVFWYTAKKVNITPIFKKNKNEDFGGHSPVSFTSVLGKAMEKILP